jgi:Raf kinase inhibitor-like YbhB/YbcL family protein
MDIRSQVFEDGGTLPAKCGAMGGNEFPRLVWRAAPEKTKTFALTMIDKDYTENKTVPEWGNVTLPPKSQLKGGEYAHLILINIPDTERSLVKETDFGTILTGTLAEFGQKGDIYAGPNPPHGTGVHEYEFKVYALDTELKLQPTDTLKEFMEAVSGHVLDTAAIVARYG